MVQAITKFIVFMLLAGAAYSQTLPLSPRLDSLGNSVFHELPLTTSGSPLLTTTRVYRQINMGIWHLCTNYPAYEKLDTVICARAVEGGALNSDLLRVTKVFRMIGDSVRVPLIPMSLDTLQPLVLNVASNLQVLSKENDPGMWYTSAYRLYTHPKVRKDSSSADTFLVHYEAMAPKLVSASDSTVIDKNFMQALVYYATAKCWLLRHRNDMAEVYFALATRESVIAEQKKAQQRGRE